MLTCKEYLKIRSKNTNDALENWAENSYEDWKLPLMKRCVTHSFLYLKIVCVCEKDRQTDI